MFIYIQIRCGTKDLDLIIMNINWYHQHTIQVARLKMREKVVALLMDNFCVGSWRIMLIPGHAGKTAYYGAHTGTYSEYRLVDH